MRKKVIPGLLAATMMLACSSQALSQAGGAGGAGGAAGGATGGTTSGGTAGTNPGISAIPVPQTPPPPQTNPGITPSAPGPSGLTPSPRNRSEIGRTTSPGAATGSGSAPRAGRRGSRNRDNEETANRAINELDKALDRKLNICRGC